MTATKAQQALLTLLNHFGINTDDLVSVSMRTAERGGTVEITGTFYKYTAEQPDPVSEERSYNVADL